MSERRPSRVRRVLGSGLRFAGRSGVRLVGWAAKRGAARAVRAPASTLVVAMVGVVLVTATGLVACDLQQKTRPRPEPLAGVEPLVRVRVVEEQAEVRIDGDRKVEGAPILAFVHLASEDLQDSVRLTAPVLVDAVGASIRVRGANGQTRSFPEGVMVQIRATGHGLSIGGKSYGPVLLARARTDASPIAVDIAAELPMESYIAGVSSAELVRGWALPAFRAQAIAARSYAAHQRERARDMNRWYDLDSTTRDQAFNGLTDDPTAVEGAESTRGIVLTWQGRVLRAYYSSTCGGRPASAADVWTTGPGLEFNKPLPLQARERSCACDASPLYRWERERPGGETAQRLAAWGTRQGHAVGRLSGLREIEVAERNVADRPSRYRVRDGRGRTYSLAAEELRVALNTGGPGLPDITRQTRTPSGDFEARVSGDRVFLDGRGFGHGVGLCQFGAQGLAEQGRTYIEILGLYYPGARIQRWW
jgi:stage II sporulation protein D